MYSLPHFKEHDPEVILEFMRSHPFVFIASTNENNEAVATQVPVFIDERDGKLFLSGHIMKHTDHHKAYMHQPNVLAVFTSPHTFVSASWYTDKKQGGSWNYMSVHARGALKFLDHAALINVLQRTTDHFENNPNSGANFKDLSNEYVEKLSKAIVAFEIEVSSIDHVFKLSQNRDKQSFQNITQELRTKGGGGDFIADEMDKRESQLFNTAED